MTQQEFDETRWGAWMQARYMNEIYWIKHVDFRERLIGLMYLFLDPRRDEDVTWVRCESVDWIQQGKSPDHSSKKPDNQKQSIHT